MDKNSKKTLQKHWIHSYEEDSESEKVFRPSDYKFALSRRPREFFQLNQDGTLLSSDSFANDSPTFKSGNWAIEKDDKLIIYPNEKKLKTEAKELIIASIEKDKLILKK
jgi:hypothetical protein